MSQIDDEDEFQFYKSQCSKYKPNNECQTQWEEYKDDFTKEIYERCNDKWCSICNDFYHNACESVVANLNMKLYNSNEKIPFDELDGLIEDFKRSKLDSIQDLAENEFKLNVLGKLQQCKHYRSCHHKSCIRKKSKTQKFNQYEYGSDNSHKYHLKRLKKIVSQSRSLRKKIKSKLPLSKKRSSPKTFRKSKKLKFLKGVRKQNFHEQTSI